MSMILVAVIMALIGPFALVIDNVRRFERLSDPPEGWVPPRVAVLVPARNEEASLGACLASLRAQPGPLRIRVLDDASEDGTRVIAQAAARLDPRLEVMDGAPLPAGWTGKNHACHLLAGAALAEEEPPEWLLFLDADVRVGPGAIASALFLAESRGADLLSVFPEQETGSLPERLILPMLSFVLLGFLPLRWLDRPDPRLAAANGQVMAFRADAYRRIGGHAGVPDAIVEDLALARAIKRSGLRLALADGTGRITCRMYRSLPEIWRGFSKNLFPAFGGGSASFLGVLAVWAACFVLPWLGLIPDETRALAAVAVGLGWGMRVVLAVRLAHPWESVLGHPLAMLFLLALALNSYRVGRSGRTVPWKGRVYPSRGGR